MKRKIGLLIFVLITVHTGMVMGQDDSRGFKTTMDLSINDVGSVICEVSNKYNASYWDYFTKTVGNNTSIINNQLKKLFPKYYLSDFNHSQDANERSNTVKFKIEGMMNINKNGKWEADLERKDPNITKISDKEFMLIEEGESMKIHLPSGTHDAKVEKNSFGKAILTYTPHTGGGMGTVLRFLGIAVALAGVGLLFMNRSRTKQSVYTPGASATKEAPSFSEMNKN
ncbi:MAG: hypothetical protein GC171_02085 [Terrimonas sp.]|nr:hypothetical protein [Terrimonas sp.]